MTIDVDSLQTFTDAELKALVDLAIAEVLRYGQTTTIREKTLQRASLPELRDLQAKLAAKIAGGNTGRVYNLARRTRS